MNKIKIFTVGHSNHEREYFVSLLTRHYINCIVDVRSTASSKLHPQFNKESLTNTLCKSQIRYVHFAEEFGARKTDKKLLNENGQVDFEKVRKSISFHNGIERLKNGIEKGFKIALMCAEAEPISCHRFSMISYQLIKEDFDVYHILKDGLLKTNGEIERELVSWYRKSLQVPLFNQSDYFEDYVQHLARAYIQKNREIGYMPFVKNTSKETPQKEVA